MKELKDSNLLQMLKLNWASSYFMMLKCCQDNPSTVFLEVPQQHGVNR